MDIKQVTQKVPFQFFDTVKAINSSTEGQQKIQDYLQSICQRLLGDRVNLEEYLVHFAVSDIDKVNASFFSNHKTYTYQGGGSDKGRIEKTQADVQKILEQTSCIRVNKGLLDICQTEDELAFILGHELGHFLEEKKVGPRNFQNSKMGENRSDFNALNSMAKAGYNLDEGMKMARRLFDDPSINPEYKADLFKALDNHQNNESRLNALNAEKIALERAYREKGIDLEKNKPTPLEKEFLNAVLTNRHVSKVEKELRALGYYDENKTLQERQAILLPYVVHFYLRDDLKDEPYMYQQSFNVYNELLHRELYHHISALRREKVKKPICQSDFELMMQEDFSDSNKWKEVVGPEWADNLDAFPCYLKEATLKSGMFEVVADDKYEEAFQNYETRRKEEQEKVKEGTDLSLKLFDELCYLRLFDKNYYHLQNSVFYCLMAPLKDVDFKSLKTGQAILKQIDDKLNHDNEKFSAYNILGEMLPLFLGYEYKLSPYPYGKITSEYELDDDVTLPPYTKTSRNLYTHIHPKTYLQNGLSGNETDIGAKYNSELLGHEYMGEKGWRKDVLPGIMCFNYCSNYQNPIASQEPDLCYFYDDKLNIIDMCAMQDKKEKIEEMQREFRLNFNKKIASILKKDFKTIQAIQNETLQEELDLKEILALKYYVAPGAMVSHLRGGKLFEETMKPHSQEIEFKNKHPLIERIRCVYNKKNLQDEDRRLVNAMKGDSSSYYFFDKELVLSLLSEEERAFFTKGYIKEADEKIFDLALSKIQKDVRGLEVAGVFYPFSLNKSIREGMVSLILEGYTDEQLFRLEDEMAQFLETQKGKEIAQLQSSDYNWFFEKHEGETFEDCCERTVFNRSDFSYSIQNFLAYERALLNAYIEKKSQEAPDQIKEMDFQDFEPRYLLRLAKAWDIDPDFSDYKVSERGLLNLKISETNPLLDEFFRSQRISREGEKNDLRLSVQSYLLGLYILNSKKDDLPLGEVFMNRGVFPGFSERAYVNEQNNEETKLESYVHNRMHRFTSLRKNYPADPYAALVAFQNVTEKGLMMGRCDFEKAGPLMASIINEEQEAKRQLDGSLFFFDCLTHVKPEECNPIKDEIISNLKIFDQEVPLLDRIRAYQILVTHHAFSKDMKMNDHMLEGFLNEIHRLENPQERNAFLDIFVSKDHRIENPVIRRKYFDAWAQSAFDACGGKMDDNSKELYEKAKYYVDKVNLTTVVEKDQHGRKETINEELIHPIDKIELLRRLSDLFVSQYDMSMMMKPEPSDYDELEKGTKRGHQHKLIAFDALKEFLKENPYEARELMEFLCSKGDIEEARAYHKHLNQSMRTITLAGFGIASQIEVGKYFSPEMLQQIHKEYHLFPLEGQAFLMSDMLLSSRGSYIEKSFVDALKKKANKGNEDYILPQKETWEHIFDIVAPKVFGAANDEMKEVGIGFLYSFIKARRIDERNLYLSAMLAAASQNNGSEILKGEENFPVEEQKRLQSERSIAKGVRLFLENLGPAGVKVGQAMASYGAVPDFIRKEMQDLKSNANRPARWTLFKWLDSYKSDGDENLHYKDSVWIGKILGSASYFVTAEKGEMTPEGNVPEKTDFVTKILRRSAKIDAEKEFEIFKETLLNLEKYKVLPGGVSMFSRLIDQAQSYSDIETDTQIGYEQYQTAKKLYGEKEIEFDGQTFKIHVCDWPEGKRGEGWADLERGYGVDLKDIEEGPYKEALSKAYLATELMMMFSGGQFDHDRHAGQMKIDRQNNVIHLFDTGAMALSKPTKQEKEALGKLMYRTIERAMAETQLTDSSIDKIASILSSEVDLMYQKGEVPAQSHYLTECMRSLLALKDYYPNPDYLVEAMKRVLGNKEVLFDKDIFNGFIEEGVRHLGLFEGENHLLSEGGKKVLGQVLFDVFALSSDNQEATTGALLGQVLEKLQAKGVHHPLLGIIHEKMNEERAGGERKTPAFLGFDMPVYMMPHLEELLLSKRMDPKILEGMAIGAMDVFNLQRENSLYSSEDKNYFGALLFDSLLRLLPKEKNSGGQEVKEAKGFFEFLKETKELLGKGNNQQISQKFMDSFLKLQETKAYPSELATKMAFLMKLAKRGEQDKISALFDANEVVKAILFSGNLDKDISKGFLDRFDQRVNGSLFFKSSARKILKWFLSGPDQSPQEPKASKGFLSGVEKGLKEAQQALKSYLVSKIVKFPHMPQVMKKHILTGIRSQKDEMGIYQKTNAFLHEKMEGVLSYLKLMFGKNKEVLPQEEMPLSLTEKEQSDAKKTAFEKQSEIRRNRLFLRQKRSLMDKEKREKEKNKESAQKNEQTVYKVLQGSHFEPQR